MKASTLLSLLVLSLVASSLVDARKLHMSIPPPPPPPHHAPSSSSHAASVSSSATAQPSVTSSPYWPTSSQHPSYRSSTGASVATSVPSTPTANNPLNLTLPFSHAPSTWSIRYSDDSYYYVTNNTRSEVSVLQKWSASDVEEALERLMDDDDQWERQEKQLARHVKRVNRHYGAHSDCSATANASCPVEGRDGHSHEDKHGKHHHRGNSLTSFYLRHAQCRACVQSNEALLRVTQQGSAASLPALADYQPAAVMKWCTLATPKMSSEQSPAVSSAPLADWEGVCIPAEAQCPSATIDMNILSPTTCAADEPVTKHSCTLCVLDGYTWQTGQRAFDNADNYAGNCVAPTATPVSADSVPSTTSKWQRVSVTELDSCPSVVASMQTARQFNAMAASFGAFVAIMGLLLCCSCLRACCMARKNRQLVRMRLANAQTVSAAEPLSIVSVPAVSSSPSPSAPPAPGYPAAAAAQEYRQPLLSSGLNPPRMSVSALYPQLQAQRVVVAQPYSYGQY